MMTPRAGSLGSGSSLAATSTPGLGSQRSSGSFRKPSAKNDHKRSKKRCHSAY